MGTLVNLVATLKEEVQRGNQTQEHLEQLYSQLLQSVQSTQSLRSPIPAINAIPNPLQATTPKPKGEVSLLLEELAALRTEVQQERETEHSLQHDFQQLFSELLESSQGADMLATSDPSFNQTNYQNPSKAVRRGQKKAGSTRAKHSDSGSDHQGQVLEKSASQSGSSGSPFMQKFDTCSVQSSQEESPQVFGTFSSNINLEAQVLDRKQKHRLKS